MGTGDCGISVGIGVLYGNLWTTTVAAERGCSNLDTNNWRSVGTHVFTFGADSMTEDANTI